MSRRVDCLNSSLQEVDAGILEEVSQRMVDFAGIGFVKPWPDDQLLLRGNNQDPDFLVFVDVDEAFCRKGAPDTSEANANNNY